MSSTDRSTRFVALAAIILAGASVGMHIRDRVGMRSVATQRISLQDADHATLAQLHLVGREPTMTAFMPDGKMVQMALQQRDSMVYVNVTVDGKQTAQIFLTPESP